MQQENSDAKTTSSSHALAFVLGAQKSDMRARDLQVQAAMAAAGQDAMKDPKVSLAEITERASRRWRLPLSKFWRFATYYNTIHFEN